MPGTSTTPTYINTVRRTIGPVAGGSGRHSASTNILRALDTACPGVDREERLFGIELELCALLPFSQVSGRILEVFADHPVFICKTDGSLPSSTGFEVVTAPMSMDEARAFIADFAPRMRYFAKSTHGCGLHIHTTRPSTGALGVMSAFLRAPGNQAFLDKVAGRGHGTYCVRDFGVSSSHFAAISLSERHGTAEFRLFSSTLHRTRLRGAMEFVAAFCAWSEEVQTARLLEDVAQYEAFTAWVLAHEVSYPNLIKVISANPAYPVHLRAVHADELIPEATEAQHAPDGRQGDPQLTPVYAQPVSTTHTRPSGIVPTILESRDQLPRFTYGRTNRANRTQVQRATFMAPRTMLTETGELNARHMRRSNVQQPAHSLGTGRSGAPTPTNWEVAEWISNNLVTDGRVASFDRRDYQMWYDNRCEGRMTSNRGISRTGQALWDHATYHANQVLQRLGYVRNSRPWAGRYVFEVPENVQPPTPSVRESTPVTLVTDFAAQEHRILRAMVEQEQERTA